MISLLTSCLHRIVEVQDSFSEQQSSWQSLLCLRYGPNLDPVRRSEAGLSSPQESETRADAKCATPGLSDQRAASVLDVVAAGPVAAGLPAGRLQRQ